MLTPLSNKKNNNNDANFDEPYNNILCNGPPSEMITNHAVWS